MCVGVEIVSLQVRNIVLCFRRWFRVYLFSILGNFLAERLSQLGDRIRQVQDLGVEL